MTNDTAKTIAERFPDAMPRPWALRNTFYMARQDQELAVHAVNHYEALEASHGRLEGALETIKPWATAGVAAWYRANYREEGANERLERAQALLAEARAAIAEAQAPSA